MPLWRVSHTVCDMDLRRRGRRAAPTPRSSSTRDGSETSLNYAQMQAIDHIYSSSPVIAGIRQVLHGELFRGGICLQRGGCDVELTQAFLNHLNTRWLQFSTDVVVSRATALPPAAALRGRV